jgi:hypothetical protein
MFAERSRLDTARTWLTDGNPGQHNARLVLGHDNDDQDDESTLNRASQQELHCIQGGYYRLAATGIPVVGDPVPNASLRIAASLLARQRPGLWTPTLKR